MQIVQWFNAHAAELAVLLSLLTALLRAVWRSLGPAASQRWPWLRNAVEAVGALSPDVVRFVVQAARLFGINLSAPSAADARDTMVEGEAGILARARPDERPLYEPSKRRLTWPKTGAIATCFAAEKPARLRGPQHDTAWCDELCAWKYPQATWDMLVFGMRLGDPRVCITTTPRPIPTLKDLLGDPANRTTRGSTYDNASNLARRFLATLRRKHEGTRLGRQELHAELLDDTPGALWTLSLFDRNRVAFAPDLARCVVAVDPQASAPPDESDDQDAPGA
jgi:phage terminase large subunit-like protein